jgi:hypothetical protein
MRQVGKVVLLATSRIYVQNLIPFGKYFHEIWFFRSQRKPLHKRGVKIGQAHRTNDEKF